MNFHLIWPFSRPKPSHKEVRYITATKAENSVADKLRLHRRLELAVALAQLTPEQRTQFKDRGSRRTP